MKLRRLAQLLVALATVVPALGLQSEAPAARTRYRGREIARTMHFTGAPWLVRESREREEDCAALLRALDVREGERVCDLGCGNGFYTLPLAERVGETGRVLAVDVQPEMLALLGERAQAAGLAERIESIVAEPHDPRLPEGELDLVLQVDVYHELSHPEQVLRAVRASLAPGGRMVLVEFREEDPNVPILPEHKMSKRQVLREVLPNGFRLVEEHDELPWQHALFFARASSSELALATRRGLARACAALRELAVHGGYAERHELASGLRSAETPLELVATGAISVHAPGTPAAGALFLRAFRTTGDDDYLDAAREAGRALAWAQRASGGWDRLADLSGFGPGDAEPPRAAGRSSFDDDATQGALRFLIELSELVQEPWIERAIALGIEHVLSAQREDGAWPLAVDARGLASERDALSIDAVASCVESLSLAHERYDLADCAAAAERGAEFLLRAQLAAPAPGWSQRVAAGHALHTLVPGEPFAASSLTTAHVVRALSAVPAGESSARIGVALARATDWLERTRLDDGAWAAFYELGTNRPLAQAHDARADRTRTIRAALRSAYSARSAAADPPSRPALRSAEEELARELEPSVRALLDALDEQGRWVRAGTVTVGDFTRNAAVLCELLEHLE